MTRWAAIPISRRWRMALARALRGRLTRLNGVAVTSAEKYRQGHGAGAQP